MATTDSVGEETAQFTISTQRNESRADEDTKIIYQDIIIKFILENDDWKVDEAIWQ